MNNSSQPQKIIITIAVLALIAGGVYFMFFRGTGPVEVQPAMTEEEQSISQRILMLTDKLNTVSIDSTFFGSILFTSLKDISKTPQEEPVGRPNPFAFIGTDGSGITVVTGASSTTQTTPTGNKAR